jgi:hypothetical protein
VKINNLTIINKTNNQLSPPISVHKNPTKYGDGNPGLGHAQKYGRVKPFNVVVSSIKC